LRTPAWYAPSAPAPLMITAVGRSGE
jgi:hypothetical protein